MGFIWQIRHGLNRSIFLSINCIAPEYNVGALDTYCAYCDLISSRCLLDKQQYAASPVTEPRLAI